VRCTFSDLPLRPFPSTSEGVSDRQPCKTSSPGLVLVVPGIVAVGLGLLSKAEITLKTGRNENRAANQPALNTPVVKGLPYNAKIDQGQSVQTITWRTKPRIAPTPYGAFDSHRPERTSCCSAAPFEPESSILTESQEAMLQMTVKTFFNEPNTAIWLTDKPDSGMSQPQYDALVNKRKEVISDFIKRLPPPSQPFDWSKSIIVGWDPSKEEKKC